MSGPIERGRRFSEQEIDLILKRAADLQHRQPLAPTDASGMTLAELEQIAAEAGIDPRHVRDAAATLEPGASAEGWPVLLGAPIRIEYQRSLDREIAPSAYEGLVGAVRDALGNPGYVSTLGKGLDWNSANPQRTVRVTVTPRAGKTTIRIEERLGNLAGGLFGGIVGGLGGGGGGAAIGVLGGAFGSIGLGLAVSGLVVVGSFFLARTIFRTVALNRSGQLRRLLDELAAQIADTA